MLTKKFLRSKKAITLIELIVAMALTVIVLAASTSFIVPLYAYYAKSVGEAKAIRVSAAVEKRLKEVLPGSIEAYVTTATTAPTHSGADGYYYLWVDGTTKQVRLRLNAVEQTFLASAVYEGYSVALDIKTSYKSGESSKYTILLITITVTKGTQGSSSYVNISRRTTINLTNMDVDPGRKIYLLTSPNTHSTTNPNETTAYKTIKFKTF